MDLETWMKVESPDVQYSSQLQYVARYPVEEQNFYYDQFEVVPYQPYHAPDKRGMLEIGQFGCC